MCECLREYEFEDAALLPLKILQYPDGRLGHASTVWDAALVLCAFLESGTGRRLMAGSRVIELGSGTGIGAIAASVLGATCVATDLELYIPHITNNIRLNTQATSCTARALDWTDASKPIGEYDWVICADCVYFLPALHALIATIASLRPKQGVIVSNERREALSNARAEVQFAAAMTTLGYTARKVDDNDIKPAWRCDDIDVIVYARV
jgi:predicted nicotinamide N-methyase